MTTVDDMLYHLGGVPVLTGVPFSGVSQAFFVDPVHGSDGNTGTTPAAAKATVTAAFALCTAEHNDVIFFIGGDSADTLTASLTWNKDYTHLIGVSAPLPGEGQRCRMIGGATTDITSVLTVSASGCLFANLKIANEADADVDAGAVVVSGSRNAFINCMIAGMLHATPAARAGSYSLNVSGSENFFNRCTIGADTITRAAANADLLISGGARNKFWDCEIISQSDTAGHFAVAISDMDRKIEFKDCLFYNFSVNWATALTNAFNITETSTYFVVLRGQCQFIGYTGIADTVTHVYGAGAAPNAGMFLSTNPTT